MLDGVSLNAPYDFFWVHLKRIEGTHLVCDGAGKEMRLPFKRTARGDRATVLVEDPLFGPQRFEVHPFLEKEASPVGPQQPELGL
jgi:hypothetical protein